MTFTVRVLTSVASPLLLLIGLSYTILTDTYIRRFHKRIMFLVIALVVTMIASDVLDYYFSHVRPLPIGRRLNSTYGYGMLPVLIVLSYYLVGDRRKFLPAWCLAGVNAAVYFVSLFTGIAFSIGPNKAFKRGPLGYTCHIISALLLINFLILTLREYARRKKVFSVIPVFCAAIVAGAVLLDMFMPGNDQLLVSCLTIATVICCIMFYSWFHLQFVNVYQENVMAEQRIKIMVSQIQPHFLFNTIATFRALCRRDPEKAATVAEKFGQYLRQNLDSLNTPDLIPIRRELDHTRIYADIEMVRFENVRVEYEIEDAAFSLPALTIQPIVENAIRHGVRGKKEGRVLVSTRFSGGRHVITVWDNGVGFDPAKAAKPSESHIGIANVRERIEKLCGGTMTIESVLNGGTTVTISIPETEEKG
ncbi:MAG: histidine kinase [Clostridia bacterium]|nr:histidine kinase [Clostridia bacterium]